MEQKSPSFFVKYNPGKILHLCLKNWKVFLCSLLIVGFFIGAYFYHKQKRYEVYAQLMLPPETAGSGVIGLADLASSFSLGDMFDVSSTENEIAVMRSHTVFLKTVKDLGLNIRYYEKKGFMKWLPEYQKPQIKLVTDPLMADSVSTVVVFKVKIKSNGKFNVKANAEHKTFLRLKDVDFPLDLHTQYGDFRFEKNTNFGIRPVKNYKVIYGSYNGSAQNYAEAVAIFAPNKKTDFISISYISTDPKFSMKLINTIIDNYNMVGNQQRFENNNRTIDFVEQRLKTLETELAQTELQMEDFKKSNNITDVEIDAGALIQKSNVLESNLLAAQTENEILKMTKDFLSNPENNYSLIPTLGPASAESGDASAQAINSYNELILQRMKILSSAKPNNAAVTQLETQIDAMRQNIFATVDRAYANSTVKLNDLTRENNNTMSRIGSIPALEREYVSIERTLILQQQLYLFLLKQREESQMALTKTAPTLVTIDSPYTLKDAPGMSKKVIAVIALFFFLLISLGYIYIKKFNKAPMWTAEEIEAAVSAPVVANISKEESTPQSLAIDKSTGGISLRQLRSYLQFALNECDGKVLMSASHNSNEGKTYIATNIAASLSLIGKKTLIIDCDMINPGVSEALGINNSEGLADVLANNASVEKCIKSISLETGTLDVLTAGKPGSFNPSDLVSSDAAVALFNSLREEYDYIVIDTPSISSSSMAYALTDITDLTLMILRVKESVPSEAEAINVDYNEGKLNRIAVIINQG